MIMLCGLELEALKLLVAPRRVITKRMLRLYLEEELSLGLFLRLCLFFVVRRFPRRSPGAASIAQV